jgi:hypothetical protein
MVDQMTKPKKPPLSQMGYRSRKLWFAIGTSLGIFAAALLASKLPAIAPLYDTMVGGLIGVQALYSGANVGAKVVMRKGQVKEPVMLVEQSPSEVSPHVE